MTKLEFDYDEEHDIFAAMDVDREYDVSLPKKNVILDLDKKGRVVGIEIMNASKLLALKKSELKSLAGAK
ncbi:hypothetical protein CMO91_02840 [Candidatus Woesearchaeota archaeon]|nr:hypothetical protein [Candidatus Woesearchaeota archaeon]|tara:strand:+ start:3142 stop:3351 length:210 start_codon:yes stop_codon:yes gene_type:complete